MESAFWSCKNDEADDDNGDGDGDGDGDGNDDCDGDCDGGLKGDVCVKWSFDPTFCTDASIHQHQPQKRQVRQKSQLGHRGVITT